MNILSLSRVLAAAALLALLAAPAVQAKQIMRVAHGGPDSSEYAVAYIKFAEFVKEKTGGEVEVKRFGNNVLGNDRAVTEMCQEGSLDFANIGQSQLNMFIPTVVAMDFPFIADASKNEQFLEAFNYKAGPLYKYLDEKLNRIGLKLIMTIDSGFRSYAFSKQREISDLASLKGLKVRTTMSPVEMAFVNAVGMNPCPLSMSETYAALQQGTVDGELINYTTIKAMSRAEVEKSIYLSRHNQARMFAVMNKAKFDALSPEMQEIILSAGDEAQRIEWHNVQKMEDEGLRYCRENGFNIVEPSADDMAKLRELCASIPDDFVKKGEIDPVFLQLMRDAQK